MFGNRVVIRRGNRDEGERPFWISFADMMTAMMVLFLVVMSVALLAVTKPRAAREDDIAELLERFQTAAAKYPGVRVDPSRHVIDFGDRAQFDTASSALTPDQERLLRSFVPEVLGIADDPLGRKWLKRVVVEGYTDQRGTYLFNLNLSLQRSQRVLCALLSPPLPGERGMSSRQQQRVRDLFLVGGYSSNSAKPSLKESRRIELRLEFYGVDEKRASVSDALAAPVGACAL